MVNFTHHTSYLRGIVLFNYLVKPGKTKGFQCPFLISRMVNTTANLFYFNLSHGSMYYPLYTFSTSTERCAATVLASRSCIRAFMVAFTTLCGFDEPNDFANTSLIPTLSNTARIAPPAITPVPAAAGLINTREPLYLPDCSCGMVAFVNETLIRFFLASSIPLVTASV